MVAMILQDMWQEVGLQFFDRKQMTFHDTVLLRAVWMLLIRW
jgi:hypothetical protein